MLCFWILALPISSDLPFNFTYIGRLTIKQLIFAIFVWVLDIFSISRRWYSTLIFFLEYCFNKTGTKVHNTFVVTNWSKIVNSANTVIFFLIFIAIFTILIASTIIILILLILKLSLLLLLLQLSLSSIFSLVFECIRLACINMV